MAAPWLDRRRESGGASIGLRLSPEMRAKLEQRAEASHRSLSGELRYILEAVLGPDDRRGGER